MVTVVENGHDQRSSILDVVAFTQRYYTWEKYEFNYSHSDYGKWVKQTGLFKLGLATNIGEGKLRIQIG